MCTAPAAGTSAAATPPAPVVNDQIVSTQPLLPLSLCTTQAAAMPAAKAALIHNREGQMREASQITSMRGSSVGLLRLR